jgi:hypothetical protein
MGGEQQNAANAPRLSLLALMLLGATTRTPAWVLTSVEPHRLAAVGFLLVTGLELSDPRLWDIRPDAPLWSPYNPPRACRALFRRVSTDLHSARRWLAHSRSLPGEPPPMQVPAELSCPNVGVLPTPHRAGHFQPR